MEKIGLFYGTDTGNTETIAKEVKKKLEAKLGADTIDLLEIYKKKKEDMDKYSLLILGMPTWYDGELQGDWEEFIPEMEKVDFSNKKVAFFGLGVFGASPLAVFLMVVGTAFIFLEVKTQHGISAVVGVVIFAVGFLLIFQLPPASASSPSLPPVLFSGNRGY